MTEWFRRKSQNIKTIDKKDTKEGMWIKCPSCGEVVYSNLLVKALNPSNLTKVSKFVGNNINGANIMDYARDVLADQMYDDWANMPSPHG